MSFRAGLYQLLSTAPTLVALQSDRVYPILLPENEPLPASTFQVVGGNQQSTFTTSGMQRRRVQIDFRANDDATATQLHDATIKFLNGFTGAMPNGFNIQQCEFIQSVDNFDSDARQFRHTAEFYFWFVLQD